MADVSLTDAADAARIGLWPHPGLTGLLCYWLIAAPIWAADWPRWRGPQRDGHSAETGLLSDWPLAGPELLWQANGVGSGFSTPSVAGKRVYLLGNQGLSNE